MILLGSSRHRYAAQLAPSLARTIDAFFDDPRVTTYFLTLLLLCVLDGGPFIPSIYHTGDTAILACRDSAVLPIILTVARRYRDNYCRAAFLFVLCAVAGALSSSLSHSDKHSFPAVLDNIDVPLLSLPDASPFDASPLADPPLAAVLSIVLGLDPLPRVPRLVVLNLCANCAREGWRNFRSSSAAIAAMLRSGAVVAIDGALQPLIHLVMRHQLDGNWEDFCTGVVAYYAALMDSVRGNAQLIDCEELQPASLRFLTFFARYWAFPPFQDKYPFDSWLPFLLRVVERLTGDDDPSVDRFILPANSPRDPPCTLPLRQWNRGNPSLLYRHRPAAACRYTRSRHRRRPRASLRNLYPLGPLTTRQTPPPRYRPGGPPRGSPPPHGFGAPRGNAHGPGRPQRRQR